MSREYRCRSCGAPGREDEGDPCPGLCPACLERALLESMEAGWDDRWARGLTVQACLEQNDRRLVAIGLTPLAREHWRRKAQAALAEELAAERRAN